MKKQLFKFGVVKAYTIALLTSIILISSSVNATAIESADTAKDSHVTYLGVRDDMMAFNVNFSNALPDGFELELRDGEGELLYYKKYTDMNFNKYIYLKNVSESEEIKVKFIIKAGKRVFNQAFEITTKQTFVQNQVVTRL